MYIFSSIERSPTYLHTHLHQSVLCLVWDRRTQHMSRTAFLRCSQYSSDTHLHLSVLFAHTPQGQIHIHRCGCCSCKLGEKDAKYTSLEALEV